jgi:hypothetical protein
MAKGKFKRSRWKAGNVYALPLVDGSFGIAQAIVADADLPGILNVGVFDYRYARLEDCGPTVQRRRVIALLATFRAEMNGGWWAPIGWSEPCIRPEEFPYVNFPTPVGRVHHSGGVLEDLVAAYHGLLPWNTNYHPDYYERLLAPGVPRPASARVLNDLELLTFRELNSNERYAA